MDLLPYRHHQVLWKVSFVDTGTWLCSVSPETSLVPVSGPYQVSHKQLQRIWRTEGVGATVSCGSRKELGSPLGFNSSSWRMWLSCDPCSSCTTLADLGTPPTLHPTPPSLLHATLRRSWASASCSCCLLSRRKWPRPRSCAARNSAGRVCPELKASRSCCSLSSNESILQDRAVRIRAGAARGSEFVTLFSPCPPSVVPRVFPGSVSLEQLHW